MISRIQITNFGAIESFDAPDMPPVVLVQGGNGTGKTSFLDAIKALAANGHDPDVIHGNAEFAEVIVTFTDGNQVMVKTTRKNTIRGWKPKDGKRWTLNRELIDTICKAIGYDPMSFLRYSESEQALKLLEIAPIEVAPEEITEAVGDAEQDLAALQMKPGINALEFIDATHDWLYKARTPLNTAAETQEHHAEELERALPPPAPGEDWGTEAQRLQASKTALEKAENGEIAALKEDFEAGKSAKTTEGYNAENSINGDIDAKIAILEKERTARLREAEAKTKAGIEVLRGIANSEAARIRGEYKPKLDTVAADLATALERARAQQQAEGTRKAAQVARQEAEVKRARSAVITAALDRLKALKVKAAGRLKIPGVQVQDGRIVRQQDGAWVPFRKWNTADKMTFCLRLAVMANGKAGFTIFDDAEHYTPEKFEGLVKTAKKYASEPDGVQFIIAKVSGSQAEPLKVTPA